MPTAVITGATKGIGKAIAYQFLKNGYDLAICARSQSDIDAIQMEWKQEYPQQSILAMAVDVSDKNAIKTFAAQIKEECNDVEILVNNAGIFFPGNILDEADGQLESTIEPNLYSAYYLSRWLCPLMISRGKGHIFNLSSIAATRAYPGGGSYSISKFAMLGLSENLRYELMDKKVKVTTLTPGAVWTNSWAESGIAPERMMKAEDIAEMVWTASQLSDAAVVENILLRPQLGDI